MVNVSAGKDMIVAEVEINAPIDRVFKAITDPRELARWWGQENMYRCDSWKLDLQPETPWRCEGKGADGTPFHVAGKVLEVDPPNLLVYTWKPSWDDLPDTIVRWELTASSGKTHLRVQHGRFAGHKMEGYTDGWKRVIGWLEEHMKSAAVKN